MADVFLSYSREDLASATKLAKALIAAGHTIWWDQDLSAGADFGEITDREIKAAKTVVVCWTEAAIRSKWVRDEAAFARDHNKLVPIIFEGDEPPLGFRQIQAIDFRRWSGDPDTGEFRQLLAGIAGVTAAEPKTPPKPPRIKKAQSVLSRYAAPLVGAVVLAGLAAVFFLAPKVSSKNDAPAAAEIVRGRVALASFRAFGDDTEAAEFASRLDASFRDAFAGYRVETVASGGDEATAEFALSSEVAREGDHLAIVTSVDDRTTGTTIWSLRRPVRSTPGVEAEAVARALFCALRVRRNGAPDDLFPAFLRHCGKIVVGDFAGASAESGAICSAGRREVYVKSWCAAFALHEAIWTPGSAARTEAILAAREGVLRALKADSGNAELYGVLAQTHATDGEWAERGRLLLRAIELDPMTPGVREGYGIFLADTGRMAEGADQLTRQYAAIPMWTAGIRAARILASQGDWVQAREIYDKVRRIEPQQVAQHELLTLVWYGALEDASAALAANTNVQPAEKSCYRALIEARGGAQVDLGKLKADCAPMGQSFVARNLVTAGDVDGALSAIERYLDDPKFGMPQLFYSEMRPLWGEPRFWKIADRMKLIAYWTESGRWPDFCSEPDLPFDCKAMAAAATAQNAP